MKSILDESVRDEVVARIRSLNEHSIGVWGKMNVFQMLRHCVLWDEMVLKNKRFRRPLIGILLGRIFLKKELGGGAPMARNNPTIRELIVHETSGDVEAEKRRWILLVGSYANYSEPDNSFVHPFFGKMTREQIGLFIYRHTDHHLLQFGA